MNCISFFMEKYPYASIGCSKFATPRPSHVLLNSQMPNKVCLCHYHENFIMLLETLCKVHPHIPSYSSQFVARFVCAQSTEHCPNNVCHEWKDGKLFYYTSDGSINRFQWEKQMWIDNKNELRKLKSNTFEQALQKLKMQMSSFVLHHYIKQKQSASYIEHIDQFCRNLHHPVSIYLFKVNNRNARTRCEICSKLKI